MSVEASEGTHPVDAGARADTTSAPATVSAVIPALNEAPNLPEVARRVPTGIDEIVFVDGNSVDSDDWPSAQRGKLVFNGAPFRYPPAVEMVRPIPIRWACDLATTHRYGQRLAGRLCQGPAGGNRHATRYQEIHEGDAPAR